MHLLLSTHCYPSISNSAYGSIVWPRLSFTFRGLEKFALFDESVNITDAVIFFILLSVRVVASCALPPVALIFRPPGNEVAQVFNKVPLSAKTLIIAFCAMFIVLADGITE